MKKIVWALLMVVSSLQSCHDTEPQPISTAAKDAAEQDLTNQSARTNTVPQEELYIVNNDILYTVDATTGTRYALGSGWSQTVAMTHDGAYIYIIKGSELWRINPINYALTLVMSNLQAPESIATSWGSSISDDYLFVVANDKLLKIDDETFSTTILGTGWTGGANMTFCRADTEGFLYIVKGDILYKVNPSNGSTTNLGPAWSGTEALTGFGTYLFGVQGGELWLTLNLDGSFASLGGGWGGTEAITEWGFRLYAVQGGELWRTSVDISGATATSISLGTNWTNTKAMAAIRVPYPLN
jgi:hypothetical protein